MKKIGVWAFGFGMLTACNHTTNLKGKADSLVRKVDSTGKKVWESGKKDMKELKEKVEDQFKKKDSAEK